MKMYIRLIGILLISAVVVSSCKKADDTTYTPSGPDMASLKKQYRLAVLDAKYAEPWEIWRSLVAVEYFGDSTAGDGNLSWSPDSAGRPRLLVVSWMSQSSTAYWPVGKTFKTSSNTKYYSWVTTLPQMPEFLKKNTFTDSNLLHLRIAQLLGMPPDSKNNFFVEFWVYPENLFRPTPDPEITDHEADLYFPAWVSQKHRDWFENELRYKYVADSTTAFPWTRLGYTYDWSTPLHPIGLSEFVVDTSSTVTVKQVYSSWQYYQLSLRKK